MKGLIITGGSIDDTFALPFLKGHVFDQIIAVDSGLESAVRLHIHPDIAVGDFDSVNPHIFSQYQKDPTISFESHSPVKDYSDTELALEIGLRKGWKEIVILGGIGSRMDHTLANIHLLHQTLNAGVDCYIVNQNNRIYLLEKGRAFLKKECFGDFISFLPLTTEVKGITLKGFRYPLKDKDIRIGSSLCISNELTEEEGSLEFQEGILICIESKD